MPAALDHRRAPADFIRANTAVAAPPLVPEIRLWLASEALALWQAGEAELAASGLPPPYWAFAWAGGQALARYLLDHPDRAAGRRVLDFAAGSGLQAIAAAKAGAAAVTASEIDPFAAAAIGLNAALNRVRVAVVAADVIGIDGGDGAANAPNAPNAEGADWDLVLAGDVFYERELAARLEPWLRRLAGRGVTVLVGDPGRAFLPKAGLERLIAYGVKTDRALEDTDLRNAVVWKVLP
ncbi:MAG: 50S ribosomal protein L11 methyltransferase [Kiloniellales bacterium]|nr:50S ribosomal protein L11 methyltransferase [Kiloniellales bacterium]